MNKTYSAYFPHSRPEPPTKGIVGLVLASWSDSVLVCLPALPNVSALRNPLRIHVLCCPCLNYLLQLYCIYLLKLNQCVFNHNSCLFQQIDVLIEEYREIKKQKYSTSTHKQFKEYINNKYLLVIQLLIKRTKR